MLTVTMDYGIITINYLYSLFKHISIKQEKNLLVLLVYVFSRLYNANVEICPKNCNFSI